MFAQTDPITSHLMIAYWATVIVGIGFISSIVFRMWKRFFDCYNSSDESVHPTGNEFIKEGVITALLLLMSFAVAAYGYSMVIASTVSPPSEQDPAFLEKQKQDLAFEMPSEEVLEENREELRVKQYERHHEEALSSYEDAMEREAEKIKNRNPELQE